MWRSGSVLYRFVVQFRLGTSIAFDIVFFSFVLYECKQFQFYLKFMYNISNHRASSSYHANSSIDPLLTKLSFDTHVRLQAILYASDLSRWMDVVQQQLLPTFPINGIVGQSSRHMSEQQRLFNSYHKRG